MKIDFQNWQELVNGFEKIAENASFLKTIPLLKMTAKKSEPGFTEYLHEYSRKKKFFRRDKHFMFVPLSVFYTPGSIILDDKKRTITIQNVISWRKGRSDALEIVSADFQYDIGSLQKYLLSNPQLVPQLEIYEPRPSEYGLGESVKYIEADQFLRQLWTSISKGFSPSQALAEGELIDDITRGYSFHRNTNSSFIKSLTPKAAMSIGIGREDGESAIAKVVFGLKSCTQFFPQIKSLSDYHRVQQLRAFYTVDKLDHSQYKEALSNLLNRRDEDLSLLEAHNLTSASIVVKTFERLIEKKWYEVDQCVDSLVMLKLSELLPEYQKIMKNLKNWCVKLTPNERAKRFHDYLQNAINRLGHNARKLATIENLKQLPLPVASVEKNVVPENWEILIPKTVFDVYEIGKKQKHCLYTSGYHMTVEKKEAVIFSLYRKSLADGVTLHGYVKDRSKFVIYGPCNRKPDPEEKAIAEAIFKKINWESSL